MTHLSIESVRRKLAKLGTDKRREIAEGTGIPLQTIRNFACGITQFPRADTFAALSDWFRKPGP